jgi:hypothetical protein
MRIVVVYDSSGNIRSLMSAPEGGAYPGRQLNPGEMVSTIEVPELSDDLDAEEMSKRLNKIAQENTVEVRDVPTRLLRKSA